MEPECYSYFARLVKKLLFKGRSSISLGKCCLYRSFRMLGVQHTYRYDELNSVSCISMKSLKGNFSDSMTLCSNNFGLCENNSGDMHARTTSVIYMRGPLRQVRWQLWQHCAPDPTRAGHGSCVRRTAR